MIVKLLTEHHMEFLSLKGGCRGLSESSLVKMSNCWKSHAAAHCHNLKMKNVSTVIKRLISLIHKLKTTSNRSRVFYLFSAKK